MKQFLLKLVPHLLVVAAIILCGSLYDPEEGDLIRLSYKNSLRVYSSCETSWQYQAPTKTNKNLPTIGLFGDSFLGTTNNPPFWVHLTDSFHVIPFRTHDFETSNPIDLCINMQDSIHKLLNCSPDFVIVEMIERAFYDNTDNLNFSPRKISTSQNPIDTLPYRGITDYARDGIVLLARNIGLCIPPCTKSTTSFTTSKAPLLRANELLFFSDDLKKRRKISTSALGLRYEAIYNLAKSSYPKSEILILVIPDKFTAYEGFISNYSASRKSIFEIYPNPPDYVLPSHDWINSAISSDLMEVYRYSDTHLGDNGAQAIGKNLKNRLANHH